MINLKEYRGVSIETILEKTGLQNPYSDQSKFSLARQKELLLKDAKKARVLDKIQKSHPIVYGVPNIISDKGLCIQTLKVMDKPKDFTTTLDLNETTHKVIREHGKVYIHVNKADIPSHVMMKPGPGYCYNVVGIFTQEKCYNNGPLMRDDKRVGTKFRFGFHSNVSLYILD